MACYAERCISYVRFCLTVCLTVWPSHCHSPVSCQNNSGYHHAVFTIEYRHDSSFLTVNFSAKFQREHRERGRWMRVGGKNRQCLANKSRISETVQDRTIVIMGGQIGSRTRAFDWYQNYRSWMTLNGQNALCCKKDASFGAHCTNLNEDRPIYATTKM